MCFAMRSLLCMDISLVGYVPFLVCSIYCLLFIILFFACYLFQYLNIYYFALFSYGCYYVNSAMDGPKPVLRKEEGWAMG